MMVLSYYARGYRRDDSFSLEKPFITIEWHSTRTRLLYFLFYFWGSIVVYSLDGIPSNCTASTREYVGTSFFQNEQSQSHHGPFLSVRQLITDTDEQCGVISTFSGEQSLSIGNRQHGRSFYLLDVCLSTRRLIDSSCTFV
jgi:hypothetical protein